jgi:hypothetical protein
MVDDKLRMLAAMKALLQNRFTTVFPRQGHYALDPRNIAAYRPADIAVERIGSLINDGLPVLLRAAPVGHTEER